MLCAHHYKKSLKTTSLQIYWVQNIDQNIVLFRPQIIIYIIQRYIIRKDHGENEILI